MSGYIEKNSLIKKASYLRIAAADLAEGMKTGNFKSLYRGQGIEFAGVRDYIPGDDIRSIDWNVTARMSRPYIKLFDEERELQIFMVVDTSQSMLLNTGLYTNYSTKYAAAAEAAALLTLAAEMNGCPVGAVMFDGAIHFSCKPTGGKDQTMLVLSHLEKLPENKVQGSVLGNALTGAGKLLKKRSLVFVFSDFRSADWSKPLISLAQKNDVIAFRLTDRFDDELPALGAATFEDMESGITMVLPTSSAKFKTQWRLHNEGAVHAWQEICLKHGIMPVLLEAGRDPLPTLSKIFNHKKAGK